MFFVFVIFTTKKKCKFVKACFINMIKLICNFLMIEKSKEIGSMLIIFFPACTLSNHLIEFLI